MRAWSLSAANLDVGMHAYMSMGYSQGHDVERTLMIYSATYIQHMVCIVLCGSRRDFPVQQRHVLFIV